MYDITEEKTAKLTEMLEGAGKITIVTHSRPDGDALGSSNALKVFLHEILGKDADVAVPNDYGDTLEFAAAAGILIGSREPERTEAAIRESDLIVCVDMNRTSRCDQLGPVVDAGKAAKILIDHHLSPDTDSFDLCFSETSVSSTCELLYYILLSLPMTDGKASRLPRKCAEALFTGMTTDTNNFANSVFPGTMKMASELIEAGVDRDDILEKIYKSYRVNRIKAFAYILGEKMTITPEGVAILEMNAATRERFDLGQGETEGLVNEPLAIKEVRMSVFLKEDDGVCRVSIRSKRGVSANAFAKEFFHGGGHELASGGRLSWPEDIKDMSEAVGYTEKASARFMNGENSK